MFLLKDSTCEEPTFENYAVSGIKIKEGTFLRLACKPGYFVYTKDMERKCTNMSLEPDFKKSPAECLTGLKLTVSITLYIIFIRIRRTVFFNRSKSLELQQS